MVQSADTEQEVDVGHQDGDDGNITFSTFRPANVHPGVDDM